MVSLKHLFTSGKADGTDSTLVKPSNWNEEHKFETATDGVVLGRAADIGPGPVQELPFTSVFPPGMIMPYAGSVAPTGWLMCQGQLLVRIDYPALVAVIGGTFNIGGETAAQFRLPDLRGRVIAGVDGGADVLPSWGLATKGGAATHILSTAEMPSHNHGDYGHGHGVTDPTHAHATQSYNYGLGGSGSDSVLQDSIAISGTYGHLTDYRGAGISIGTGYANLDYRGSSLAHNNVQPTIALNYLIKT